MKENLIDFKYVPLSFIKQNEIERQSINTIVFQKILEEFGELKPLWELLDSTQYGFTASAQQQGNCRFLRITDINDGHVNWDDIPYCNCEKKKKYKLSQKDILIARTGNNVSYLVANNVPKNTVFASYLIRLSCNQRVLLPEYLYLFLNSYAFWPQILKKQRGALLQNVNAKKMAELLIPYCSIDIQKKLITDGSKSIFSTQEKVRGLLHSQYSLSTELTHQQTLLKKLRQQILQEAIEGKLTADWRADNPDTEPASVLLARIQEEKAQLIKDKKIKKQKPLSPISEEEKPFALPEGWVWCRLDDISSLYNGSIRRGPFGSAITKDMFVKKTKDTFKVYEQKNAIYKNPSLGGYYILKDKYDSLKSFIVKSGDIIISCAGTIGETFLLPNNMALFALSVERLSWICHTVSGTAKSL